MRPRRALFSTLTAFLLLGSSATSREHDAARAFLATSFQLTKADFDRIDGGQVVSRTMEVSDAREVATFGVVGVKITPEFYVERLANIVTFKKDEAVLQIGAFGDPPDLLDVKDLTLDDSDIRSLRRCRVGDCGVQLSADAIDRFRREVDWRREDVPQQANGLMRRILVDYVTRYLRTGAAASMEYADQSRSVNLEREFVSLAESGMAGWAEFPALRRYLFEYPEQESPGTIDRMYWSKERVGARNVISVTQLAIMHAGRESPADYTVASKQIYGTHYYDASLGLTILLRDRSAPSTVTYIAYLNRSRIDIFDGLFGGVARHIVSSKARGVVTNQLARLQRTLEREFAAVQTTR